MMMMARKSSIVSRSKRCEVHPDWANMHSNVLGKIFNGLDLVEKRSFASVCHSWRTLAKDEIKLFFGRSRPKSLLLLLPDRRGGCYRLSLDDGEEYPPLKLPLQSDILGSCRGGWLLLMTRNTNLVLWNPRLDIKIHLPSVLTLPCVKKVSKNLITKAVLFGSDPMSGGDCGVVVIYGGGKLGFVKYGDSQWSDLGGEANSGCYIDVTCFKDSILALSNTAEVEVWNLSTCDVPKKTMEMSVPVPQDMVESKEPLEDKLKQQLYIVESQDSSVLLVVRWIADFVHPDGFLFTEDDPLLVSTYQTKKYYVYKLDSEAKRWVPVESLGNQVLFLGGNQSLSLNAERECNKNAIYFTDELDNIPPSFWVFP